MKINRSNIRLYADVKKVIVNYLSLGVAGVSKRTGLLVNRVLSLEEVEVDRLYQEVKKEFSHRHRNLEFYFDHHYNQVKSIIPTSMVMTNNRKMLLGAFFTKEYSIRSAALFNPSVVSHPDQSGLTEGDKRFVMSLRAVGEGHISSIEFRSGIVNAEGRILVDKETGFATTAMQDDNKQYDASKLKNRTRVVSGFNQNIFKELGGHFTKEEYLTLDPHILRKYDETTVAILDQIVDTNYDVVAHGESQLSERIVFPSAKQESKGMEDVRFVEFIEDGISTYIGTYTAYNGHRISPQLIITKDFKRFKVRTMYGEAVNDKGFALFPRKINGQFVMLGRQGGEKITIMYSDNLFIWENYQTLMIPELSWGLTQLGNCGSPIKTDEGWLVLTHAVGPMRKYVMSAILLDLKDPSKIIKKLKEPLISPNAEEREGYVPNVVYSCGSMKHRDLLVIPYAMSDSASTFATVNIQELLNTMEL
jgi:predicted GH43/DUF377 family glycosyl hydrolase